MRRDPDFMRLAIAEAEKARARGEVPVGAVLVRGEEVIAAAGNSPIELNDPSAHAEMLALRRAGQALGNYRLDDTVMYVTLEPCLMCAAALVHARVRRVVFGAFDPKAGGAGGLIDLFALKGLNHRVDVFGGVLEQECGALLSEFFASVRA
ncbi:MAG: tRNA adenosine(34) deaminase TadA [Pseudomonadota bacterium]|jgi:tRNA(adenine34) deaminase|nr:MAG: tRNA adenosine(34) deaminase TadA [Pseudomonadota bacterium]